MGLIGGSCGLGLFIGSVRRFSSGAILCSAMCYVLQEASLLARYFALLYIVRMFSRYFALLQYVCCKKVLCWCGRCDKKGGDKKVPSGRSHHLAPCSTLLCKQIHKYTHTQIHTYTHTHIHTYLSLIHISEPTRPY